MQRERALRCRGTLGNGQAGLPGAEMNFEVEYIPRDDYLLVVPTGYRMLALVSPGNRK